MPSEINETIYIQMYAKHTKKSLLIRLMKSHIYKCRLSIPNSLFMFETHLSFLFMFETHVSSFIFQ